MRISAILLSSLALIASAQPPATQPTAAVVQIFHPAGPLPSYEVATIKRAAPDAADPGKGMMTRRSVSRSGQTVKMYIQTAYPTTVSSQAQVVGGPTWINTDTYVIQGKMPDELRAAMQKMNAQEQREQNRMMQQSLLADRFQLKVHFEVREMPIFELMVAKGGLKIKEVPPPSAVSGGPPQSMPKPGEPLHPGMLMISSNGNASTMNASATTMSSILNIISRGVADGSDRPVLDKTGFTGHFDVVDLEWASPNAGADVDAPSLVTALEEKLGLKLVATKGPVEVIVIDSIERPSEN